MTTHTGWAIGTILVAACIGHAAGLPHQAAHVRPGITVLLEDSIGLVSGKRIALLTNQTGIDAQGVSDIDLLARSPAQLVALFSPEHGIRGTEDRENLASGRDSATGLPVYSLYANKAVAPPDSLLEGLDVILIDLQDVGTRTWTYVGSMLYTMQVAARRHIMVIVLDRPNPLTGRHVEGPVLDSALATQTIAYALWPLPLRHGLTMGELARMFNHELALHADLHVMPADGWRREMWFDETHLPWVRPSPNLPSSESELIYPALVAFEASNLSVGRGTAAAFQQLGAPWLDAAKTVGMLNALDLAGVRFHATTFTPVHPTDGKYGGRELPAVRVEITDRERAQVARIAAALLWSIARTARDSMRLDTLAFDLRLGSGELRRALVGGGDPDETIDHQLGAIDRFEERTRRFWLYH